MPYIINSDKMVSQTLSDLRQLFTRMGLRDDWEAYPEEKGIGYSVRYYRDGQWITANSYTQPTKALNLRACYLLIQETWRFERLGMLAAFQRYVSQALVPSGESSKESAAEFYGILGVDPQATDAEIEAVFRTKAKFHHPDGLGPGAAPMERKAAEERFKHLNAAYEAIRKLRTTK